MRASPEPRQRVGILKPSQTGDKLGGDDSIEPGLPDKLKSNAETVSRRSRKGLSMPRAEQVASLASQIPAVLE